MNKEVENNLQIGTILNDKWVILEFIGRGGMGEVYRAHQLNLKRDVAIKVISKEWIESLQEDEEELVSGIQRFKNEMHSMAQVRHANILPVFDQGSFAVGVAGGEIVLEYIAMEFVPGGSLRSTMSDDGFYPEEGLVKEWIRKYFLPILNGVEALHEAGIVHRDIKPENILLDRNIPKITDFGLAHSYALQPITQSAEMRGTPAYMPPEQFSDFRRTDERTDVYALGKILYEAVEGRIKSNTIPFRRAALSKAGTPFLEKLDSVIQRATEEDKERRFSSVAELRSALAVILDPEIDNGYGPGVGKFRPSIPLRWIFPADSKRFIGIFLVAVIGISLGITWVLWSPKGPDGVTFNLEAPQQIEAETLMSVRGGSSSRAEAVKGPIPKVLVAEDGVNLHLIPGGTVGLPNASGFPEMNSITLKPFYMDETLVTNHQYVDFLNRVISRIQVKEDVVKSKRRIWLLLGEVLEGYEPVIYRGGRFHVNKPAHASCPVVRVTAYGAAAYAEFYGKRLPSVREWLYSLIKGEGASSERRVTRQSEYSRYWSPSQGEDWGRAQMTGMMGMIHPDGQETAKREPSIAEPSHFPSPVLNSKPNALGIRGLNEHISEWALKAGIGEKIKMKYAIMGSLGGNSKKKSIVPAPLFRKPWEAFEEVGFRTVLDLPRAGK
ncbi:MAG: protein kinase [Deltaproteobacteria bacterium]|nr:protein kinase [Deltaproteobacteria bacterium]